WRRAGRWRTRSLGDGMKSVPVLESSPRRAPRAARAAAALAFALFAWLLLPLQAQAADQRTFSAPEAAVDALIAALKAHDEAALVALLGDKHKSLVVSGDAAYDSARR